MPTAKCVSAPSRINITDNFILTYTEYLNANNKNVSPIINLKGQSISINSKYDGRANAMAENTLFVKILIVDITEYRKRHLNIPVYSQNDTPNLLNKDVSMLYRILS